MLTDADSCQGNGRRRIQNAAAYAVGESPTPSPLVAVSNRVGRRVLFFAVTSARSPIG